MTRPVRPRIGDLLRQRRKELAPEKSQAEWARELGYTPETLCRWERNAAIPSDENLWTLAKAMGFSYDAAKLMKAAQRASARGK